MWGGGGGGGYYSVKQTAAYLGVGNPIAIVDENTHHIIWFIWYTEDAADACAKGNPRCALMWCAQNKAHWTQIFHWNNTTHIANVAGGRDHTCGWVNAMHGQYMRQWQTRVRFISSGLVQFQPLAPLQCNRFDNCSLSLTMSAIGALQSALYFDSVFEWRVFQFFRYVFSAQNNVMQLMGSLKYFLLLSVTSQYFLPQT